MRYWGSEPPALKGLINGCADLTRSTRTFRHWVGGFASPGPPILPTGVWTTGGAGGPRPGWPGGGPWWGWTKGFGCRPGGWPGPNHTPGGYSTFSTQVVENLRVERGKTTVQDGENGLLSPLTPLSPLVGDRGRQCAHKGGAGVGCARTEPPISPQVELVELVEFTGLFFASWTGFALYSTFRFYREASGESGVKHRPTTPRLGGARTPGRTGRFGEEKAH